MTSQDVAHAQQRMQQKWHDLVIAEQQGATIATMERMYNAYILSVEEYNRYVAQSEDEQSDQSSQAEKCYGSSRRRPKAS